jgi:hypothetical protein
VHILKMLLCSGAVLSLFSPLVRADSIDLYDFAISVSGSANVSADWQDLSSPDPTAFPLESFGLACCGDASGGTTPGLGTISWTIVGAGTYTVNMYFDYDAAVPDFNEFGVVNGSAPSGVGYEIFNANSTSSDIQLFGATGTPGAEVYGTPNNTNEVPGTGSNFLADCTTAGCNADVGLALSYTFTIGADQKEVLTAIASTTNPGGFSIEDVHPVDSNNAAETDVFLTGSEVTEAIGTSPTPEPASGLLLGAAMLALVGAARLRRKLSQDS